MNEDQFNIAIGAMAQQRNAALDAVVQLQVQLAIAQEKVKELEAELFKVQHQTSP